MERVNGMIGRAWISRQITSDNALIDVRSAIFGDEMVRCPRQNCLEIQQREGENRGDLAHAFQDIAFPATRRTRPALYNGLG